MSVLLCRAEVTSRLVKEAETRTPGWEETADAASVARRVTLPRNARREPQETTSAGTAVR